MMKKVILMCQQGIPFERSPARFQMINELKKRGCWISVFFPGRLRDKVIKEQIDHFVNTDSLAKSAIREKIKRINPDIVISFTIEDTLICSILPYTMKRTDFYYYNLEIYVCADKELNGEGNFFVNKFEFMKNKIQEILYVHGCKALVIQDSIRKKVLKKYGISSKKTFLIPNSYYINNTVYSAKHIGGLIYTGGLDKCILESFMEGLDNIKDVKITLSGWKSKWLLDNYGEKLKKYPNIICYMQSLEAEEYSKFISAYDIAFIWYSDRTNDNVYYIGLSSGKFFKHLSLGQPVITVDFPGVAHEVRKYKLGVVIHDLSELGDAITEIYNNYEFYSNNVKRVYKHRYDYGKVSKKFYDYIVG